MVIDITARRQQEIEDDVKGLYLMRLSLDYLLHKGKFENTNNPEDTFVNACKEMDFTVDMQNRIEDCANDFVSLPSKEDDFVKFMMGMGSLVLEDGNNQDKVDGIVNDIRVAVKDKAEGRFSVEFDSVPGRPTKMYRHKLDEPDMEQIQVQEEIARKERKASIRIVSRKNSVDNEQNIER